MSNLDYSDAIITRYRTGDADNPYIDKVDTLQIENSTVVLTEIPVRLNRVQVSGQSVTWAEVDIDTPTLGTDEYKVDYANKIVYFNSSRNGLQLTFTYKGRGLAYIPSTMVYTQTDNGNVTETLNDIITAGQSAIANLDSISQAITNANTATTSANSAATSATNAATTANTTNTNIQNAESSRVTAESNRVSAETSRVSAESSRVTAESSRVSAESSRVSAESSRVTAENNRVSAESARASAETTRASNETTRQSQETARQDGYNAFKLLEPYNNTHSYIPMNKVAYNGSSYQCILASTGNLPTNTTYWVQIAAKGADGSGSGTVLSVSSANADIGVTNPNDNPVLTLNSGSGANQIVKRDGSGNIPGNITGNAATVTTNADLAGDVTSIGNTTSIAPGVIVNADINSSAAIDASKIANGSVSNTEFQYLDGVTSPIQNQIGVLSGLNTTDKSSAVSAINEVNSSLTVLGNRYKKTVVTVDANGKPTQIDYKRLDNTLYKRVIASNPDANGNYQTIVETTYASNGTTVVSTITYTCTYDSFGNMSNDGGVAS
jgi:hypothetical protein